MNRRFRYAGFWRRSAAAALDLILFRSLLFLLNYVIYGSDYLRWRMNPGYVFDGTVMTLLNYCLLAAVIVVFWIRMAATPGKLLLGCRVVDADTGKPLRPGQAVLRLVSLIALCFGFIYAAWDSRKQGLHDKIARTVVIVEDEADQLLQEWQERR